MVFLVRGAKEETLSFLRGGKEDVLWRLRAPQPDAVLVMPGGKEEGFSAVHTAVIPLRAAITAKQIISYGLEQTCTVTLSSRRPEGWMLALQRDIVTLHGVRIERQEIPVPSSNQPENTLALAGGLLAAGCPPERLFERMSQVV